MTPYRGLDADALEREYSPSSMIGGDYMPFINRYVAESTAARAFMRVRQNLPYGRDPAQVLDFFPAEHSDAPLHIFIHGGYWQELSQKESASMAPGIVARGSAFATLNYRLAPIVALADIAADIRLALLWLSGQGATLGYNPGRVTLSGHSAGAHLAAMILSQPGDALLTSGLVVERAVLISGVYDLTPIPNTSVNDKLGLQSAEALALSPLMMTPAWRPAITVAVAEHDTAEFRRQSRDYIRHLHDHGVTAQYSHWDGLNHFDIILNDDVFCGQGLDESNAD